MFIRLSANRDEFQPINFQPGFNAVIADRAQDSTDQDSRNARGKSTMLMLMNYVLASNCQDLWIGVSCDVLLAS